jgi:hypothetical protein
MPGKTVPWKIRPQGSCCSTGYRRHKPAGLVALTLQQLLWVLETHTQKADPRTLAAQRLGSPVMATAAVVPRSLYCGTGRLQGLHCLEVTRRFSNSLNVPWAPTTSYSVVRALLQMCKWIPGSTLLYYWHQEASFPREHGGLVLINRPSTGVPPLPHQRAETHFLHWVVICHTVDAKRPANMRHKKAQHFSPCPTKGECLLLS